ncbi:MAG: isoaspartyl peptidase/L-asparaginase [Polyangiaceae bacterium]|nr:isoaspartyl peptidase/L-asparaginase [Polyangiaceae bacterium]
MTFIPTAIGCLFCIFGFGCRVRKELTLKASPSASATAGSPTPTAARAAPAAPSASQVVPEEVDVPHGAAVVAVGGIESTPAESEPLVAAARAASAQLVQGAAAVDAAVAGVVVLEDDPRLNAGTGAHVRFDGATIECDAAVMDEASGFAAVGALQHTRNPVRVARALLDTPHRLLMGEGARLFARSLALEDWNLSVPEAKEHHERLLSALGEDPAVAPQTSPQSLWAGPSGSAGEPRDAAPRPPDAATSSGNPLAAEGAARNAAELAFWRSRARLARAGATAAPAGSAGHAPPKAVGSASVDGGADTVAVLVRTAKGHFAGATSSGGPELALAGRVGDVVVPGAALWVAEDAAVVVSARGERVLETRLALRVYERLRVVRSARLAAQWGLAELGEAGAVVVVNQAGSFIAASTPVAWAENQSGGETSSTPLTDDSPPSAPPRPPVAPPSATAPPPPSPSGGAAAPPPATTNPRPAGAVTARDAETGDAP